MNPLYFLFALSAVIGGAILGLVPGEHTHDNNNQGLINVDDASINERVDKISNEINNMLGGQILPGDVHSDIFDEKFFAKDRAKSLSGPELEENNKFINYLNTCDAVVSAYEYQDSNLDAKISKMNSLKNELK